MSSEDTPVDDQESEATDVAVAEAEDGEDGEFKMSLSVEVSDAGPCLKHVKVIVPRVDIDYFRDGAVGELSGTAQVPGFRTGHVPRNLLEKRFKTEIDDQVKQNVLVASLEQIADENDLDPINEPKIDVEDIIIPEEGAFEYEFDVEVRPEFDVPDYAGIEIERKTRDVSEDDVEGYKTRYLAQYAERKETDKPAAANDFVTVDVNVTKGDERITTMADQSLQLKPTLRFQDAEIDGFDKLLDGVIAGDTRETDVTVSSEAPDVELRGESLHLEFQVKDIRHLEMPELNKEFFERIEVDNEGELSDNIRSMLERQITYQQRQQTREQVLAKITESADWDLPEDLVTRQTENALRREMLEMRQAGFTTQELQARETEIRQNAISTTRQALKEHFVLDKIATAEDIEAGPGDIDHEISMMAMQSGESPRRVRARLSKSGMIDNLEAQIRERKAVDFILEKAVFKDEPMDNPFEEDSVQAVLQSVCGQAMTTSVDEEEAEDDADPES